jgi:hypothetical protein
MESEIFSKFIKENPALFLHPALSPEDRETLEQIFLYKDKLINEIKELEEELGECQFEIEQIDISDNEKYKSFSTTIKILASFLYIFY